MQMNSSHKSTKPHADLITFCLKHKRIHLYGAGVVAHRIAFVLNEEGINVCDAIVTNKNTEDNIICNSYKISIVEVGNVNIRQDDGVVIATAEADYISEIIGTLKMIGLEEENLFIQEMYDVEDLRYLDWDNMHTSDPKSYFREYRELNGVGVSTDTDKVEHRHNFLNKYEFFLHPFKEKDITLVELGIYKGGSVNMWRKYFKYAHIYGVDIDENCTQYVDDGIRAIITDLSKPEIFDEIEALKPDIVIDDASHIWSHQISALIALFPVLPHGGVYILEDIHTSFASWESSHQDEDYSPFDFCTAIAFSVSNEARGFAAVRGRNEMLKYVDEIDKISKDVEMISFIAESCIIIKR